MRRLALLLTILTFPAPADELPVTGVVMSSSGLMQVDRGATLPADASATFHVPVEAVDDVLKSLLVRDPAGTVEGVRLPARDLAAEAFRGLPLKPDDFENRAALLNALRGQVVEAGGTTGRIGEAAETEKGLRLALITPAGVTSVLLGDGAEARLQDAALATRVARAAEALATARGEDGRLIEVLLRGTSPREVAVTTVLPAPVWKPSWRLVVPSSGSPSQARLQGWAVVENLSGADWDRVRLTLVSGEAASLHQPLYEPIRVPRQELPLRVAEGVRVEADTGPRPVPPPPAAEPMSRSRAYEAARAAPAPVAQAAAPALAAASAGRIAFTLPSPVSMRAGMTANLPFLDVELPAERVWWIQDLVARHPLQAVRITNASAGTLPDGIVTVFGAENAEAGAWLGDAEMRALPSGQPRLLAFGRDRDVLVTSSRHEAQRAVAASFRPGQVALKTLQTEELALAIDPRGARGPLLIDLPRREGARPLFPVQSEGDYGLRHRAALDGTPVTLRLAFEREAEQLVTIWDAGLGDPLLLSWRSIEVQPTLRRLPGGPGTLESLRAALDGMPPDAPGRDPLARLTESMAQARTLLDAFTAQWRAYATAEAALNRARAAAEDRSGAAKEEARRALNRASLEVEQAGTRADNAWEAWQRAVQGVLASTPR
ncbi:hypothetical protein J5Y10_26280 [Roseomonas sp. SG15]|uniref:DUF4139 domain-containing protein n=2 Tax=Roseomonas indoligenes TaxID=2820811 RepID=A0A940SAL3_9PROT|nr:hypothetical protein [Pararoseomonas indoligenes]